MPSSVDFIRRILKLNKSRHSKDHLTDVFRLKYDHFKSLLDSNAELSKIVSEIEEKLQGDEVFGMPYIRSQTARAVFHTLRMIKSLDALSNRKYPGLMEVFDQLNTRIRAQLDSTREEKDSAISWVLPYSEVTRDVMDAVGGKNANLGEVLNKVHLPVPEGFAISTSAYHYFLSANDLIDQIGMIKMNLDPNDPESVNSVSEEIQHLIISAAIPEPLRDAILAGYDEIASRIGQNGSSGPPPRIAMRSSAIGEDSELSFAGQYLSVLNVPRENILKTYTIIIASLFTPRAISYRLMKGVPDEHAAMSVACIRMIDSVASGVIYTRHPFDPLDENVVISAVWGLGPYAVDGAITPDSYTVGREGQILQKSIPSKRVRLVSNPDGGLHEEEVAHCDQDAQCLSDQQIATLAEWALRLEKHYGAPQDIEWALDKNLNLFILQSRPLCSSMQCRAEMAKTPRIDRPPLLEQGAVASPGIGCGKAFRVLTDESLLDFPQGGVLIAIQPSPKFMVVMPKASAIVTDFGSVTGHMASLAREFSIPTLLDTRTATTVIEDGMELTVDAFNGRVYQGIIPELLALQQKREPYIKGTPVYESLRQISALITPLRLFDPKSPSFTPYNCKSLHDIMRFVHEVSYSEMFRIGDLVSGEEGVAVKLSAPIPFDLYLIDLGGGLKDNGHSQSRVKPDCVVSAPFNALLKGMLHKELVTVRPRPIELKGFFSVMGEQMLNPHLGSERFGEKSYALISDKYLNFSSRVGYHYGVLDTYCGTTLSKNYITFSFKGGAADDSRRNRRARAIALILESLGMNIEVVADRVDARIQKLETPLLLEKLDIIGRLFQFTRQLDMLMTSDAMVGTIAKAFLEEKYHL